MAAISTSSATPAAGAAAAPAIGGATQASAGAPTDPFTQLIQQMLAAAATPAGDSSPELLDLSADTLDLPQDEHDSDIEDPDSDDAALALTALLAGFAPAAAQPASPTAEAGTSLDAVSTPSSGNSSAALEAALLGKSEDADVTRAAIDALTTDTADAAGNTLDADRSTPPAATQNSPPPPPIHALMTAHTAAGDVDVTPDATLRQPVGTHAWKDELGTQLTWMAINNREAASLRLAPEHLGPLEVRITMTDGQASVMFGASNPETRSALEQSLPRLREMFASNGIVLADAGVSRDAPKNAFKPSPQARNARGVSDASDTAPVKSVTMSRLGLVDTYV